MALPHVHVTLNADGTGEVLVNGEKLPGVLAVEVRGGAGHVPQVLVTLRPTEMIADLPEGTVTVVQSGPTAADFADQLSPARLEGLALEHLELHDGTNGEAFAAAVTQMADEYTQARA